jgi:hypothetical protein
MTSISEVKLFSESVSSDKKIINYLRKSSVSDEDADLRLNTYKKVFENLENYKSSLKSFSSYADNVLRGVQYFDASVIGLLRSFAGFLAIERALDQPTGLLYFLDLYGVATNSLISPNIGQDNIPDWKNKITQTANLTNSSGPYNVVLSKKLIPGTVKLTIKIGSNTYECFDDKNGSLLGPPAVLDAGTVNYSTGAISFTLDSSLSPANTDTYVVIAIEDQGATDGINRTKLKLEHIKIETYPEMLIGETDLSSIAAMNKSLGIDPGDLIISRLQELYTKLINKSMVREIITHDDSVPYVIDLTVAFNDFRSTVDKFYAELSEVETLLSERSYKGAKVTCYLVGKNVLNWFKKQRLNGSFVDNVDVSYVNDLMGFVDGVPVLHHLDVDPNEGYAIHKTADGQIAPVGRGILLPLNSLPLVGNYQNPSQQATGVYYQEGVEIISTKLVQKFKINV